MRVCAVHSSTPQRPRLFRSVCPGLGDGKHPRLAAGGVGRSGVGRLITVGGVLAVHRCPGPSQLPPSRELKASRKWRVSSRYRKIILVGNCWLVVCEIAEGGPPPDGQDPSRIIVSRLPATASRRLRGAGTGCYQVVMHWL